MAVSFGWTTAMEDGRIRKVGSLLAERPDNARFGAAVVTGRRAKPYAVNVDETAKTRWLGN